MYPTLRPGDGLTVLPYAHDKIRIGDVAAFRLQGHEDYVVHRVVSVLPGIIRTRGDNNSGVDAWVLHPADIIGRVVSVRRKDRTIRIYGRTSGRVFASGLYAMRRVNSAILKIGRPIYHWLARPGAVRNLLVSQGRAKVLCFNRRRGMEMQLLMDGRVVGRRPSGKSQWEIQPPFRLFVDEKRLPRGNPDQSVTAESVLT
jgi:hypothetical protein